MPNWKINMPCRSFVSTTLIFPCYNVVLHKSQKWAGINQPLKRFPNTKHVQDIGYLSCDLEISILQITNKPDGSEGYLISISWHINHLIRSTKYTGITTKRLNCKSMWQSTTNFIWYMTVLADITVVTLGCLRQFVVVCKSFLIHYILQH